MYIYANGCSMTYGSELHDDPVTRMCTNSSYRWERSWPGALGLLLKAPGIYNDGIPSGSNDRIVRTAVEFVTRRWLAAGLPASQLLVVIGWSHPGRREFFVEDAFRQVVPHHAYDIPALDRLTLAYRNAAWHETESRWRFAIQSITLAGFLRDRGVRYLFFDAIVQNELPAELNDDATASALLGPRNFVRFGDSAPSMATMLHSDTRYWTGQHPSEEGHAACAARLAEWLDQDALPGGPSPEELRAAGLPRLGGTGAVRRHDVKESDQRTGMRPLASLTAPLRRRVAEALHRDPFLYP
jgi:Family of unknown function (DUF6071)